MCWLVGRVDSQGTGIGGWSKVGGYVASQESSCIWQLNRMLSSCCPCGGEAKGTQSGRGGIRKRRNFLTCRHHGNRPGKYSSFSEPIFWVSRSPPPLPFGARRVGVSMDLRAKIGDRYPVSENSPSWNKRLCAFPPTQTTVGSLTKFANRKTPYNWINEINISGENNDPLRQRHLLMRINVYYALLF